MILKRYLPVAVAIAFGLLLLLGLLLPVPALSSLLLNWAGFLAAVALILGVLNLLAVHIGRLYTGRNLYSGVLILSMVAVFGLAIADMLDVTEGAVTTAFNWIQAPLEAALASLMAFFLLLAGFRLFQRRRNVWSFLFLLTALIMLLSDALITSPWLPDEVVSLLEGLRNTINAVFVTAGMRGILIGVALGTVTLSLRLLVGIERPYSQ
jgi:hypothetical protein